MKLYIITAICMAGILYPFITVAQQSPYGTLEVTYGLSYSHTNYKNLPGKESGEGGYLHLNFSFLDLLFCNSDRKNRVTIGDLVGANATVGIRQNNFGDGYTDPFYPGAVLLAFGYDLGLQGFCKIDKNWQAGLKYYYHGYIDGANSLIVNSVSNDFDVLKLQGCYKPFMFDFALTKNHSFLKFANTHKPNDIYHSYCFKYLIPKGKKVKFISIDWERYRNNNIMSYNFINNNLLIGYGTFL